jgi:hypothetical protein
VLRLGRRCRLGRTAVEARIAGRRLAGETMVAAAGWLSNAQLLTALVIVGIGEGVVRRRCAGDDDGPYKTPSTALRTRKDYRVPPVPLRYSSFTAFTMGKS